MIKFIVNKVQTIFKHPAASSLTTLRTQRRFFYVLLSKKIKPSWSSYRCVKNKKYIRAFTFYEILVALAVFGITIPMIVQGFMTAQRSEIQAERRLMAAHLGDSFLNEYIVTEGDSAEESAGDFGEEHEGYRWELETSEWIDGNEQDFESLTLTVFYIVKGSEYSFEISTYMPEKSSSYASR